ncbi:MAG: hypothetical protein HY062_03700 [Bacteroidetes bacterium]|nr:hypothetical protein [Bacteroidota bacterium]
MKNYMLIASASLLMLVGCKNPMTDETVIRQRDSLLSVIDERDSSVDEFISSFNDVESNLNTVTSKQGIIMSHSDKGDIKSSQKDRINSEIKAINELMDQNTQKLKDLTRKLNRSSTKNAKLQKTIELLNNQLTQKYAELAELNERLNSLNGQVAQLQTSLDTLSNQNSSQSRIINEKNTELHTAYYVVGHSKELKKSKLIDKEGGVLGMGRTAKLTENPDNSKFTKIDYTQVTVIPVNSKEAKLITTHPSDSYRLDKVDKTITNLVITNPEKFWSASKYLVLSI